MEQLQEDEKWLIRTQLALEELKGAKRDLAELEMGYEEETRAFHTMLGGCALIGGACVLFLAWMFVSQGYLTSLSAEILSEYGTASLVFAIPMALILPAPLFILVACAPAGYVGLWRMIRGSGWFVVGGGVFWLIVFLLFMTVPMLTGPFFLKRQHRCVRNLEAEVAAARGRLRDARSAIS